MDACTSCRKGYTPRLSVVGISGNSVIAVYCMAPLLYMTTFLVPLRLHCTSCHPPSLSFSDLVYLLPCFVCSYMGKSCMKKHLLIPCTLPAANQVGMFMVVSYSSDLGFLANATSCCLSHNPQKPDKEAESHRQVRKTLL